jgi:hypothetical protein
VWVLDGGRRRHVVSIASMDAWRFAAPVKSPAAALHALPQGPDWRSTPFLVQGTAPSIYVLDLAPSTPPGTEPTADPQSNGAQVMAPAIDPALDPNAAAAPASGAGGCRFAPAPRESSSGGLLGGGVLAMLRAASASAEGDTRDLSAAGARV